MAAHDMPLQRTLIELCSVRHVRLIRHALFREAVCIVVYPAELLSEDIMKV